MHSTIIAIVFAATASLSSAAAINSRQSGTCAPGTGYYQVCGNGFTGCCTTDACSVGYCPGSPVNNPTTATECAGTGAYYVCANNKFRGHCSVDPCAKAWCPDFTPGTCVKSQPASIPTPISTPTVQCAGTGDHYVCANNGFIGQCSVDPCALSWCPDYNPGTCTKAWEHNQASTTLTTTTYPASTPTPSVVVGSNGVCPQGSGYFQVCSNGFKGCCQKDACAGSSPVCPY